MKKRVFKWYILPDCIMPEHGELVHFDDTHNIMHLGRYNKKDQFGREDVFITTEGAHFTKDKVEAWIPAPHSRFEKEAIECSSCDELAKEVLRVVKERDGWKNSNDNSYNLWHKEEEKNRELQNEIEKQIRFKTEYKEMYQNACANISELESAFAGAEEMVKDKIKRISELESGLKEIMSSISLSNFTEEYYLPREVISKTAKLFKPEETSGELFKRIIK